MLSIIIEMDPPVIVYGKFTDPVVYGKFTDPVEVGKFEPRNYSIGNYVYYTPYLPQWPLQLHQHYRDSV